MVQRKVVMIFVTQCEILQNDERFFIEGQEVEIFVASYIIRIIYCHIKVVKSNEIKTGSFV